MKTFYLPDLGEGLQEAEIVSWHVGAGDHVVADQPLVSVETEKAVVEIPSPRSGRLKALFAKPGDIVKTGAALVEFDDGEAADTGTVVGRIESEPAPATESVPAKTAAPPTASTVSPAPSRAKAPPAIRARAAHLGIDLAAIAGTGPKGAITTADLEAAVAAAPPEGMTLLHGPRRAMATNMARAHAEVAPAGITETADIDSWGTGVDVTIRLARAIALACKAEPSLNAWYDGAAKARRLHETVDLGIAVDTEDGLFVPVLRDVGNRDASDLRHGLEAMKADVRARRIPAREMRGQTFTLSNFGTMAGRDANLVIMPPQVAILGVGKARDEIVAVDRKPAVRRILPLSLTFDHRAVNGGEASRFLAAAIADLEKSE